ncbi:MAG: NACHT domain-containing protein [Candidatus Viridilinea halotolerans]|uniref:NACHT domain-containing protein n=1 Tax=Candidatus Viridilinea halotolerans TaxID=2491704 RepID=A0A426U347_9CHLR|nr:MAG: NACHT domain-containing protein [Candidatus Viridilinea halotolerans]
MKQRNETFGRLLKAGIASIANCEGKTAAVVEEQLGAASGVSGDTIQRYKSGALPPDPRTIQMLATAAVQRGFMGREWLQRFLHAARYPQAEALLEQLCPAPQVRPRPPRVYANLPAPSYSQFVMRTQAFAEVVDGLRQRSAAVLIIGMGGNGKTSLAREIASACLQEEDAPAPRFDAAVWVSDKDQPGTTNLSIVLDTIARTLDYPGFAQFEHNEKQHEVEQLLRRQRVLLIVDNFETITDGALLTWLLRLPEPSKALITSRAYSRAFRNSTIVVELRGMTVEEVQSLITHRLRILRIDQHVASMEQLDPLIVATGGNPKAIEITLGLIKYERRPLPQIVDDLYAARGEIFTDLFERAWALLDEAARRVLMVATFFPTNASGAALSASADVQGFAFDRAIERLADMSLIDVQITDMSSPPRYALHPLVRAFAEFHLKERHEFEELARKRWANWFVELTAKVGYCWDDLSRLGMLDMDIESVIAAFNWAEEQQQFETLFQISQNVEYFFWVRGLWMERKIFLERHLNIAFLLERDSEKSFALARLIEIFIYQEDNESIKKLAPIVINFFNKKINDVDFCYAIHAISFYYTTIGKNLLARELIEQSFQDVILEKSATSLYKVYLSAFYYRMRNFKKAKKLFSKALDYSYEINYIRNVIFCQYHLANIEIMQGNDQSAELYLVAAHESAHQHDDQGELLSEILYAYARLYKLRSNIPHAKRAIGQTIDLFERLGMRHKLTDARRWLQDLEAGVKSYEAISE